jgi:methyl-accepting chemotaxis protein
MNIKTKISLFTAVFLLLMVACLSYLNIVNVRQQGEVRVENYRDNALMQVESELKNLVDLAYTAIDENYNNYQDKEYLAKFYGHRLKNIIDAGSSIIDYYKAKVTSGEMTLEQAQAKAKEKINAMRFDEGAGYIWINDTGLPYPKMVMHPITPALEGQVMDDPKFNTAFGKRKNLFTSFVEITEQKGEGFVDYIWPKFDAEGAVIEQEVDKLSYVRRDNDWGWILGTGIYMDDALEDIKTKIKDEVRHMFYNNGTGYFWINDTATPYPHMVMHPVSPQLVGQTMSDEKYNSALGNGTNLFVAFNEATQHKSGAVIDYLWPKPLPNGELSEPKAKISYVKRHRELGWIVGTGAYIDNIEENVAQRTSEINEQIQNLIVTTLIVTSIFVLLALFGSFIFANSLVKPIIKLTKTAEKISKGKELEVKVAGIDRKDEVGALARSVERLRKSTKMMFDQIRKK